MINNLWTVFSLDDAVSGISNSGIDYDQYTFTLGHCYHGVFDSEEKCKKYIENTMKDYKKRGVGEKTRFVIMQVFCYEDDEIFNCQS
jgi:hypothetical protein